MPGGRHKASRSATDHMSSASRRETLENSRTRRPSGVAAVANFARYGDEIYGLSEEIFQYTFLLIALTLLVLKRNYPWKSKTQSFLLS